MINVRLHGTSEEVQAARIALDKIMDVEHTSKEYNDKGISNSVRVYVDGKLKKSIAKDQPVVEGLFD